MLEVGSLVLADYAFDVAEVLIGEEVWSVESRGVEPKRLPLIARLFEVLFKRVSLDELDAVAEVSAGA